MGTAISLVLWLAVGVSAAAPPACAVRAERRTVRGTSLTGLIEPGRAVTVLFGYYDCHPVERGDVVAYHYAGDGAPIIKLVQGLPGDRFALKRDADGWRLLINGRVAANAAGKPYLLPDSAHRMLALYERDYRGVIPRDAYLILGNRPEGTLDSTRFGLVGRSDILGKVDYGGGRR